MVGKQAEFIDKCCHFLTDNGILVLELGITNKEWMEVVRRPGGMICEYPSEKKLTDIIKDRFELIFRGDSVMQGGDNIPRYVFHFKKIWF
jgi:hypothetical protein